MSYAATLAAHARLSILLVLAEAPEGQANCSIITDAVREVGLPISRDQARTHVSWLAEQGLVKADFITESLCIATITVRGQDVAAGRASVPGVKKPSPRG